MSVFYSSLIIFIQTDLKKIIAYSSIAHMNFAILGLFTLTIEGLAGSLFFMFGHGLISAAMFYLVGILYDRFRVRDLRDFKGLISIMPKFSVIFLFFSFANVGFPLTINFISEMLILFGLIKVNLLITLFSLFSMVLSVGYSL